MPPIPETAEQVRSKVKSSLLEGSNFLSPLNTRIGCIEVMQRPAVHGFPAKSGIICDNAEKKTQHRSSLDLCDDAISTEVNCFSPKLATPVMTRTTQGTHLHWLVCDHTTSISYLFPARIFGLVRKHPPLKNSVQYSLGWGGEGKFCGLSFEVMIHVKSEDFSPFCSRLRKEEGISHRLLTSWC